MDFSEKGSPRSDFLSNFPVLLFFALVVQLSLAQSASTAVQCVCNTPDCQQDARSTCTAQHFCYVQIIPASTSGSLTSSPLPTGTRNVLPAPETVEQTVRGCIDDRTPLLCENRRPLMYEGAWPVLLCCRQDWCNRDVIPTLPAWAGEVREVSVRPTKPVRNDVTDDSAAILSADDDYYYDYYDQETADQQQLPVQAEVETSWRSSGPRGGAPAIATDMLSRERNSGLETGSQSSGRYRTMDFNPLFVGIPAACLCVVLATVLLVVFIVRHRRYRRAARKSSELLQRTCVSARTACAETLLRRNEEQLRLGNRAGVELWGRDYCERGLVPGTCLVCGSGLLDSSDNTESSTEQRPKLNVTV